MSLICLVVPELQCAVSDGPGLLLTGTCSGIIRGIVGSILKMEKWTSPYANCKVTYDVAKKWQKQD